MNRLLILTLFLLVFVSCSTDSAPKDLLAEELYETMFLEFIILHQVSSELISEEEREELRDEIYTHYGVSEEQFRRSHEYYQNQQKLQSDRIDSISVHLRDLRDKIEDARRERERQAREREQADSLDQ